MDFKNAIYKTNDQIDINSPDYINITHAQLKKILSTTKHVHSKFYTSPSHSYIDKFLFENESIIYNYFCQKLQTWKDKGFFNNLKYNSICDLIRNNIIIDIIDNHEYDDEDISQKDTYIENNT